MIRDHDAIEELLAVEALGGLDGDDRASLDRMLADHDDCAVCRRLRAAYGETAAALAASLDPEPVDLSVADRIIGGSDELAERRARRARRWVPIVAVAAVIALVGAFVIVRDRATTPGTVNWAQRVVAFDGGSGEFAMAYVPGRSGVVLWGDDLPQMEPGQTLELWMITDDVPVKGACIAPTDGRVAAFLDADVSEAEVMAVTVESTACPDAPTADPIFTAPLA
jgi:anti-sigma-K factor RskA